MKLLKTVILSAICFCLTLPALAEEGSFWTDGTLDYNGHPVTIHAIVNDNLPEQFQQIRLKGKRIKQATFMEALSHHFTLAEGFGTGTNYETVDDFFIRACAPDCSILAAYWDYDLSNRRKIEQDFPIENPILSEVHEQCVAFLEELGYKATENVGYTTYFSFRSAENCIVVLIPYEIEGLSTEYIDHIVNRSSLSTTSETGSHIMDYPWADFTFNSDLQLVRMEMMTYYVASSSPLSGTPITWQEAAEKVLDYIVPYRVLVRQSDSGETVGDPDYDEEQFWQDYSVRLVRALPMWMPNWSNVCIPGWCIKYEIYNEETDFFFTQSYCVDIFTGEVAAYKYQ